VILRAAWVVPVSSPPIRNGFVAIDGDRIAEVGTFPQRPAQRGESGERARISPSPHTTGEGRGEGRPGSDSSTRAASPAEEVIDLGDVALLPGLVNPHTHLELTCYAGQIPPAPFWDWIRQLIPLRAAPGQFERESAGVRAGAWQSLRAGVTCVGDISRCNLHWRVLRDIPIRKVCFAELLCGADHPPRDVAGLRAAFDEIVEDDLLTAGVTPHTPWTVTRAGLRGAMELAAERRRPWTTHWAETREEVRFVAGDWAALPDWVAPFVRAIGVEPPGRGAFDYLQEVARDLPPGLLAHVNYIEPDEVAWLAASGHHVAYCPRAHAFFKHPPHPLPRLLAAGVPVALGTDSAASNTDLSLLHEARHVLHHFPPLPLGAGQGEGISPLLPPGEGRGEGAFLPFPLGKGRGEGLLPPLALGEGRGEGLLSPLALGEGRGEGQEATGPSPDRLLRMITINAAAALGLDSEIGSLSPGKLADLAAFPCPPATTDPIARLLDTAPPAAAVWVAGKRVV
jgi:cytosine/adenosine deaminase-related metal-dependent hydrolase